MTEAPDADALAALPLAGAAVGALAGSCGLLAALVVPHPLAAAVAFAAGIVLTGALHVDGFLDGCDAFFASAPAERRFEILKDPRHGTFAVAGMAVVAVLWLGALLALPPRTYPAVLAFAAALARAATIPNAHFFRYAGSAIASSALARTPALLPLVAGLPLLAVVGFALGPLYALAVPLAPLGAWLVARWIAARLGGGLVGDAYGFTIVVLEASLLCAFAAVAAGAGPGGE